MREAVAERGLRVSGLFFDISTACVLEVTAACISEITDQDATPSGVTGRVRVRQVNSQQVPVATPSGRHVDRQISA
ncbi:hypothetical protein ACQP2U_23410 [Nocardia sp. CA-084685]|uniref:hypothetical protein n=1 Tax=Nocardia sp. CA-084685 TaxID=3239970 RepID=UPI003D956B7C